jgi:hypothetical protein
MSTMVGCNEELIAPDKSEYRVRHAHPSPLALSELLGPFRVDRADSRRGDDDRRYLSSTTRRVVQLAVYGKALIACSCGRLKTTTPSKIKNPPP